MLYAIFGDSLEFMIAFLKNTANAVLLEPQQISKCIHAARFALQVQEHHAGVAVECTVFDEPVLRTRHCRYGPMPRPPRSSSLDEDTIGRSLSRQALSVSEVACSECPDGILDLLQLLSQFLVIEKSEIQKGVEAVTSKEDRAKLQLQALSTLVSILSTSEVWPTRSLPSPYVSHFFLDDR